MVRGGGGGRGEVGALRDGRTRRWGRRGRGCGHGRAAGTGRGLAEVTVRVPQHDVELTDPRGRTPLELAVSLGHLESVRVLLRHNANVGRENANGWTGVCARVGAAGMAAAAPS